MWLPGLGYYDANSDGFFYEMASVDGWKRRQPNKPVHQSMSNGMNSSAAASATMENGTPTRPSYGATLARGQVPRHHCVLDDSSASSSVSEDTNLQDVFGLDSAFSGLTMGCDSPFRPLNNATSTTTTTSSSSTSSNTTANNSSMNSNHHRQHHNGGSASSNGSTTSSSSTTTSVSRPESLLLTDQILPGFNADKFIQDLSFSGLDPAKVLGSVSCTPADPWASRCGGGWALPSSSAFDKPMMTSMAMTSATSSSLLEDDDNSSMLLKNLEKIWATPVGGLNA
ncbi:unnamed protein product [Heligmosomoides polygyrus]|uniref:Ecdysone-induced protein 74EF n=1 Tax=Heligmosomoides polygyrus TaxID=6339 RepID=A0A183FEL6_HELPZ|nr:unnamed protein product [Heligmosomoides polygyrus]